LECFKLGRNQIKEGETPESFVLDHLEDDTDDSELDKDDMRQQIIATIATKPKATPRKHKTAEDGGDGDDALVAKMKRLRQELENAEDEEQARKKLKLSDDEQQQYDICMAILDMGPKGKGPNKDTMKDICKWNRQLVGGNNNMLMARLIDGQMYGRLSRCPSCTAGKLQLFDGMYSDSSMSVIQTNNQPCI
jgi:hypothetical protein